MHLCKLQNATGSNLSSLLMFDGSDGLDIKQEPGRLSGFSPVINSANLTPERFQQPVKMLNSLQQGQMQLSPVVNSNPVMSSPMSWSGHMTSVTNQCVEGVTAVNQQMMSPYGVKLDRLGKEEYRRRSSSTSGPPLDDQGEDWGLEKRR